MIPSGTSPDRSEPDGTNPSDHTASSSDNAAIPANQQQSQAAPLGTSAGLQGLDPNQAHLPALPGAQNTSRQARERVSDISLQVSGAADAVDAVRKGLENVPEELLARISQEVARQLEENFEKRLAGMQQELKTLKTEKGDLQNELANQKADNERVAQQLQDLQGDNTRLQNQPNEFLHQKSAQQQSPHEQVQHLLRAPADQGAENPRVQDSVNDLLNDLSYRQSHQAQLDQIRRGQQQLEDIAEILNKMNEAAAKRGTQAPAPTPAPTAAKESPAAPERDNRERSRVAQFERDLPEVLRGMAPWFFKTPSETRGILGSGWTEYMKNGWLKLPEKLVAFKVERNLEEERKAGRLSTASAQTQYRKQQTANMLSDDFGTCARTVSEIQAKSWLRVKVGAGIALFGAGSAFVANLMAAPDVAPWVMGFISAASGLTGFALSGTFFANAGKNDFERTVQKAFEEARDSSGWGRKSMKVAELYCMVEKWKYRSLLFPGQSGLDVLKGSLQGAQNFIFGLPGMAVGITAGVAGITVSAAGFGLKCALLNIFGVGSEVERLGRNIRNAGKVLQDYVAGTWPAWSLGIVPAGLGLAIFGLGKVTRSEGMQQKGKGLISGTKSWIDRFHRDTWRIRKDFTKDPSYLDHGLLTLRSAGKLATEYYLREAVAGRPLTLPVRVFNQELQNFSHHLEGIEARWQNLTTVLHFTAMTASGALCVLGAFSFLTDKSLSTLLRIAGF